MADEVVITEQPAAQVAEPISFDGIERTESTVQQVAVVEEKKVTPVVEEKKVEAQVFDANGYVKSKFGWETEEAGIEELKTLREKVQAPAEIKFANEQSKKVFDYIKEGKEDELQVYLTNKKQLERAEKLDLTNSKDAAEVIRLNLQYKYPDLTLDEITDIFQETYVKPAKPIQTVAQTTEEYQSEMDEWNQQCQAIDKRIIREAKMAKPDLAKYKSELVLPDIPKVSQEQQQAAPTPEELAQAAKIKGDYMKTMGTALETFSGYNATYKDAEVEIPIAYKPSKEESAALMPALEKIYTSYDSYFGPRWTNADGSLNTAKVAEDIHLLENKGSILQKLVNESGAQRIIHERKVKSNIEVDGGQQQRTFIPDEKALQTKKEDAIWS